MRGRRLFLVFSVAKATSSERPRPRSKSSSTVMISLAEASHHYHQPQRYQQQSARYILNIMGGGKREKLPTEDEITLRRFKKLKIHEEDHEAESEQKLPVQVVEEPPQNSCQALILRPVAPSEETFRLVVSSNYGETFLGQKLLEIQKQQDSYSQDIAPADEADEWESLDENKQLVLYQAPLAELLKEAAFLEEHKMQL